MDYSKHYNLLIERARVRVPNVYTEKHHVIPVCMGGGDRKDNLVRLTPEEHYVAHQLLVKIHPGVQKLVFAAHQMSWNRHGQRLNNRSYGWVRRKHSQAMKGNPFRFKSGHKPYKPSKLFVYNGHTYASGKEAAMELRVSEGTISNWRKQYTNWISQYTTQ